MHSRIEEDDIDPYQVLGVSRDASAEQIRTAYRRLARQHHPDLNPGSDATRFRAIHEAYRSLAEAGGNAPGYAAGRSPASDRPAPTSPEPGTSPEPPTRPEPNTPPEPAEAAQPVASPLAGASILIPLAVVVCAPGPLLLCGVLLAPVGAVLGHVARRQAKRSGQPGAGLALAGIVVGWALTAILLTAITLGVLITRGE